MKLYEFGPTRSIRARWTLQELGVDFEAITVDLSKAEHTRPEFLAINRAGKLPVLVDDGLVLTESIAIVCYLAEKYPQAGFMPKDLASRAEVQRWLLFTATELEQPLWRMARHTSLYPQDKRLPADVELARVDFKAMAQVMERHLKGRSFVVGESATVADFVLAYTLDWANEVKLLNDFPVLREYMEKMYRRPQAPPRIATQMAAMKAGKGN